MCEARIEKAALSVQGVSSAEWNKETRVIEIVYDPATTEILKVHEAIAAVGHDTELVTASDEVYENLPACCHYKRLEKEGS